jgi:heme-degrading monooxygenase HmoA
MTTIGMQYDVCQGKEDQFKKVFAGVVVALTKMPGHVATRLFEDVLEPGNFLIMSRWKSLADFKAFIVSDGFKRVTEWGKAGILRGQPRHHIYKEK